MCSNCKCTLFAHEHVLADFTYLRDAVLILQNQTTAVLHAEQQRFNHFEGLIRTLNFLLKPFAFSTTLEWRRPLFESAAPPALLSTEATRVSFAGSSVVGGELAGARAVDPKSWCFE